MVTLETLKNIRFVLDASGKESAVQVSMKDWQTILAYLEEVEDRADAKELLARLRQGPEKAGALAWQKAKSEW
jgi:predicted DNA-binding protein